MVEEHRAVELVIGVCSARVLALHFEDACPSAEYISYSRALEVSAEVLPVPACQRSALHEGDRSNGPMLDVARSQRVR